MCNQEMVMNPDQIKEKLELLLNVKHGILRKTLNPSSWIDQYLKHATVQEFILNIITSDIKLRCIKTLLQQLIEKEELCSLDAADFRNIREVSEYLYEVPISRKPSWHDTIVDFKSFDKFLAKTVEQFPEMNSEYVATVVSQAIYTLQHCYQNKYEEALIKILIYQYQSNMFDDVVRLKTISLENLCDIRFNFLEQTSRLSYFKNKNTASLQAFLFQIAVQLNSSEMRQLKELLQQVQRMIRSINPLNIVLEKALKEFFLNNLLLTDFKQKLGELMQISSFRKPVFQNLPKNSLLNVLNTKPLQIKIEVPSDYTSILTNSPVASAFFEKLGLSEYYPKNLHLEDALCIRSEPLKLSLKQKHQTVSDAKKLPFLILHKILSYDPHCRGDLYLEKQSAKMSDHEIDDFSMPVDDFARPQEKQGASAGIHPVDSLLAVILCSDDFLLQDLLSRLAKCQLAIPFLFPDPFTKKLILPLWAMHAITKEWQSNNEEIPQTKLLVSYKMPIICFIRFGQRQKHGISKSQILNEVISDSHYDHFFHRDCPGGKQKSLLCEGLVDMCWYLPTEGNTVFPDAITFLNLHGDARNHAEQMKYLSQISFMCFVMLTEPEEDLKFCLQIKQILKKFEESQGGITLLNLCNDKPYTLKSEFPKVSLIQLSTRNADEVKEDIRKQINMKVTDRKFKSIESMCRGHSGSNILIDEDSQFYRHGLQHAEEVKSIIEKCSGSKDLLLPLQGKELWQKWTKHDKEHHRQNERKSSVPLNDYISSMEKEKKVVRKKQLQHIMSLNPVMESFIVSLLKFEGPENKLLRNYYFHCLRLKLNDLSRELISGLQSKHRLARSAHKKANASTRSTESTLEELKKLQSDINKSSLGVSHLLRELGQVYEAAQVSHKFGPYLSRLPKAAAQFLIDGYPLELMDGDAAHLPLTWILDVLQQMKDIIGDESIFVLSVLGLQSTGKSTLLNTAFGLQFKVSAGRCTRGAFMQLIRLDEELLTRCRYVLVVDTEGLRAPELDLLEITRHDNELATFVIGLADMTLINIKGTVPGEINDILQTSVHAFLRMTKNEHTPSCQFVHQNSGADLDSEVGQAMFAQTLNEFTVAAAKEEKIEGKFKTFNEVIQFDDQSDVHHFPGLWIGNPPMAPVNWGYSFSAQKLKHHFIKVICKKAGFLEKKFEDLSLTGFSTRIEVLWDALLKEKYVFSFRNTLEITAYNSLEDAYYKWEWKLQAAMTNWEDRAENQIKAADVKEVPEVVKRKCNELDVDISKELASVEKEMEQFFEGKYCEILAQWKTKFKLRLKDQVKELKKHARNACKRMGDSKVAIYKIESKHDHNMQILMISARKLLATISSDQEELNDSLQRRNIFPEQLQNIIERKLFTTERVEMYRKEAIISESQAKQIKVIIHKCDDRLTISHLNEILLQVLDLEQALKILRSKYTTEDLRIKFNHTWIELTNADQFQLEDKVDVEESVKEALDVFFRSHGNNDSSLSDVASLEAFSSQTFIPEIDKHYSVNSLKKMLKKFIWHGKVVDQLQKEVIEITKKVIERAKQSLQSIIKEMEHKKFSPIFIKTLLESVDNAISDESAKVVEKPYFRREYERFTFKPTYRHAVCLFVCGYAVPKFRAVSESYWEENDPQLRLSRVKEPLFAMFENTYNQAEAEEAIANTLCASLEEPIKSQIYKKLGLKVIMQMKDDEPHFEYKGALKVKILTDLHSKNSFAEYMHYVSDVKSFLKKQLQCYTVEYCEEKVSGENTRLQELAIKEVYRLTKVVTSTAENVREINVQKWLKAFSHSDQLTSELGELQQVTANLANYKDDLNLENFRERIRIRLNKLTKALRTEFNDIKCESAMQNWKVKPHKILIDLIGCTAQCPFCGEQCDLRSPDHLQDNQKHRAKFHRPDCLNGYVYTKSNTLAADFCPSLVDSTKTFKNRKTENIEGVKSVPYSKYQSVYPDWYIPFDNTSTSCLYWKWFVGTYQEELREMHHADSIEVPSNWKDIEWEDIQENFKHTYYHHLH